MKVKHKGMVVVAVVRLKYSNMKIIHLKCMFSPPFIYVYMYNKLIELLFDIMNITDLYILTLRDVVMFIISNNDSIGLFLAYNIIFDNTQNVFVPSKEYTFCYFSGPKLTASEKYVKFIKMVLCKI